MMELENEESIAKYCLTKVTSYQVFQRPVKHIDLVIVSLQITYCPPIRVIITYYATDQNFSPQLSVKNTINGKMH
jgi:hypothetical protein